MAKPTIVRTRKRTIIIIATTMLRWTMFVECKVYPDLGGALVDVRWRDGDEVGRPGG